MLREVRDWYRAKAAIPVALYRLESKTAGNAGWVPAAPWGAYRYWLDLS